MLLKNTNITNITNKLFIINHFIIFIYFYVRFKNATTTTNPVKTKLTKEQKASNKKLSSQRITVEHINREIKIFKITSERLGLPQKSR
jgi:hypothetical protein